MKDFKIIGKTLVEYEGKGGDVTIPDGVEIIGGAAFYDCKNLTSVTIPDSVTGIGDYAFAHCPGIASVIIPNSVKHIGCGAFTYCSGLTSVTIPNSVMSIGDRSFYSCSKLNSVTIENGVTDIGACAFADCSNLTSITIPNSVTSIRDMTFYGCKKLASITIPNSVTIIGGGTFWGCTGLISETANYKAFHLTEKGELMCRDKIYTVGKESTAEGELNLCNNGIHYCTNLFDIFNYYCGEYDRTLVIGICEVSDENIGDEDDSKRCARWVKPTKILSRKEVINLLNNK